MDTYLKDIRSVRKCVQTYRKDGKNVLDEQFIKIVEINLINFTVCGSCCNFCNN